MANSDYLFITVTVRHTEGTIPYPAQGYMPRPQSPRFRAHKMDQADFSYPMRAESLKRFQHLVDVEAVTLTRTKLYSNRVVMFYSVN